MAIIRLPNLPRRPHCWRSASGCSARVAFHRSINSTDSAPVPRLRGGLGSGGYVGVALASNASRGHLAGRCVLASITGLESFGQENVRIHGTSLDDFRDKSWPDDVAFAAFDRSTRVGNRYSPDEVSPTPAWRSNSAPSRRRPSGWPDQCCGLMQFHGDSGRFLVDKALDGVEIHALHGVFVMVPGNFM